jgi:cellulose synthase/poly-beta-1,6-N-acetylglucosamine synthase-like glycosyltransferase/glycosyltransferase involved in cell wall biosynthesis/O-antigen/teichoic acid export membrane protein
MIRHGLSIIVPTYNEAESVPMLIERIAKSMAGKRIAYEIIFIDDRSTDATRAVIQNISTTAAVSVYIKKGKRGKGYSLMEGVSHARYDYIAQLDADLQYPPEILPELFAKAKEHGFGVANRRTYAKNFLRRFLSRANAFVFGRLLLNVATDVQSGLKIFPREVFEHLNTNLVSAWATDMPLIFTAYELGLTPGHVDIDFEPRKLGSSKVTYLSTAAEVAMGAVKTRLSKRKIFNITSNKKNMIDSGIAYKRKRYVTHTTLSHRQSALITFSEWQQVLIASIIFFLIGGLIAAPLLTLTITTAFLSLIYFVDVLFTLFVILKSLHIPPEITAEKEEIDVIDDATLPIYTILCPLYKEANVLPHFIESMGTLNWPQNKLDIQLLLEEDDEQTIEAARSMTLPSHIRIIVVPNSQPKTKPKACNYGLSMAKGEYIVVFDAEDKPDPDQLKKAYLAFKKQPKTVVCMQAKLNYYNPNRNLLTRLFTSEYSLWFDVVLPGLQSIQTTIPLGGTSNHFRTEKLLSLNGWDPFNVTEDCDLGARLFKAGYKTAIIDSTTLEEANSNVKNWFRQRSRWIKGYFQTYLVHLRNPLEFLSDYKVHAPLFQLIIGARISFMLINPFLWFVTISYFTLYGLVGPTIEAVYPSYVFYMAAFSLVLGNFIYLYNYMIGCAKRGHWELIKYVFFVPIYWLMISISAIIALVQLFSKPHYWEKTIHGLDIDQGIAQKEKMLLKEKASPSRATRLQRLVDTILHPQYLSKGILVLSALVANVLNFAYNAYLGRHASIEDFGVISLIGSFLYISGVPLNALSRTVTHKSAYLLGQFGKPVKEFWLHTRTRAYTYALVLAGVWIGISPVLQRFFHTDNIIPFLVFTPVWVFGTLSAIDGGFLGGNLRFTTLAVLAISEALGKLVFSAIFVGLGLTKYVYTAVPLSIALSFGIAAWNAKRTKTNAIAEVTPAVLALPTKFFATSVLSTFSSITFLSLDLILAKHYLSPADAGAYSFLTLAGKMVYFLSSLATQFTNPLLSHDVGSGHGGKKTFAILMLATLGINLVGFTAFGIFGFITVPLLWGPKAALIVPYLPLYTFAMMTYSLTGLLIAYHQIRGEYAFSIAGFLFSLIQLLGMFLFHGSLQELTYVISGSSILTLIGILCMHIFYKPLSVLYQNTLDFLGLFNFRLQRKSLERGKLRILIMNWYDAKHIWAGGAEQYIDQIAKRWADAGHEVTFFCGNDTTQKRYEKINGVSYIRRGGQFTVAMWAFIYYVLKLRNRYDIVVDIPKGVPFFTPLYSMRPVIALIHQVHQDMFRTELRFPLRQISMFLEAIAMPLVYRNMPIIVVSKSTKRAVEKIGLSKRRAVDIINPGIDVLPAKAAKTKHPSVLYLGRLRSYKFVDLLIIAVSNAKVSLPDLTLTIAGTGEDEERLKALVQKLDMEKYVTFAGRVTEQEKANLYSTHWMSVQPSMVEGWGITNIEANFYGTPVIAANTDGLRDSVKDGYNGILVAPQDPATIEQAIIKLVNNKTLRAKLSANAKKWAANFSWDKSAEAFMTIMQKYLEEDKRNNIAALGIKTRYFIEKYLAQRREELGKHPVSKFVSSLVTKIL